jgi:nucleotide-binding universal stress UspA family protein
MSSESFSGRAPIVVGVLPKQHPEVLQTARDFAISMGAPMVCAYVDEASYLVEWDPAKDDADIQAVRSELSELVGAENEGLPVEWTLRLLTGDPARALGRLAHDVQASMIVVGTPERGLGHRLSEVLNGSVGSWLSHHQSRPVLIVPTRHAAHAGIGQDDDTSATGS